MEQYQVKFAISEEKSIEDCIAIEEERLSQKKKEIDMIAALLAQKKKEIDMIAALLAQMQANYSRDRAALDELIRKRKSLNSDNKRP